MTVMKTFTDTTNSKTFKVCTNKGNKRIWIEGNILAANGFTNGRTFTRAILQAADMPRPTMILDFSNEQDGRMHKVAGTADRPIIDLCGKYVTEFFDGASHYVAWFGDNSIIIERA